MTENVIMTETNAKRDDYYGALLDFGIVTPLAAAGVEMAEHEGFARTPREMIESLMTTGTFLVQAMDERRNAKSHQQRHFVESVLRGMLSIVHEHYGASVTEQLCLACDVTEDYWPHAR